ncbi:MAG: hypothetical protein GY938_04970 [Ketobacter sp.]|nr:hypothetical protein [Ketobacter sp.]
MSLSSIEAAGRRKCLDRQLLAVSGHSRKESIFIFIETFYPTTAVHTLPYTKSISNFDPGFEERDKAKTPVRFDSLDYKIRNQ